METQMKCGHCGSARVRHHGSSRGYLRGYCDACHRTFAEHPAQHSEEEKQRALELYLDNAGIRTLARFFKVSPSVVSRWIRQKVHALSVDLQEQAQQLETAQWRPEVIEMDELYTFVKKKRGGCRYGWLMLGGEVKLLRMC